MKHGTRPTRAEKKTLKEWGLVPENWLVVKHTPDYMTVEHRHSGEVRTITLKEDG